MEARGGLTKLAARALFVFGMFWGASSEAGLAQGGPSEHAVKAAFLYNFAKFVQWPANAFATSTSPLVIAILGNDPFGQVIDETMNGKSIDGHPITIRRIGASQLNDRIHMLFVPAESMQKTSSLAELKGKPVLIVGESEGFARRYGHINFVFQKNKLGFEINAKAARSSGLSISSKLLQLAIPVD